MCLWEFLDETSIWICGFSKVVFPPRWWVGLIQSTGGLNRTQRQRKEEFSLSWRWHELGHSSSPASAPWFSGLWTLTELHHPLSGVSGLQVAIRRLLSLHNCMIQFRIINMFQLIFILLILFLREPWLVHFPFMSLGALYLRSGHHTPRNRKQPTCRGTSQQSQLSSQWTANTKLPKMWISHSGHGSSRSRWAACLMFCGAEMSHFHQVLPKLQIQGYTSNEFLLF